MKVQMRIAAAAMVLLAGVACEEVVETERCPGAQFTSNRRPMSVGAPTAPRPGGTRKDVRSPGIDIELFHYQDGFEHGIRPVSRPDREYAIQPTPPGVAVEPSSGAADSSQCIARSIEFVNINYDLATGWTEFVIQTDRLSNAARSIPAEHCLITDDPSGWSTIVADEDALGTIMWLTDVVRFTNDVVSGEIKSAPVWQGNRFLGYIAVLHLETLGGGSRSEIIVTSW